MRPEHELAGVAVEAPAGEGACGFLDVLLAVVALAEGEELHHLAREILVGRALAVLRAVEIDHHRRIARDGVQQRRRSCRAHWRAAVAFCRYISSASSDLLLARHEMVVPEERHALGQRRRRRRAFRSTHQPRSSRPSRICSCWNIFRSRRSAAVPRRGIAQRPGVGGPRRRRR